MKVTLLYDNLPIGLENAGGMWLGIGFGSTTMLGADLVICQWDDSTFKATCTDHRAATADYPASHPSKDNANNVKTISGVKGDNKLEIRFERYMETGDSTGDYAITEGATLNLLWAYGDPNWNYHGLTQRGQQQMLMEATVESDIAFNLR